MTQIVNHKVSRPMPSAEWTHEWRYRGWLDVHGFRHLAVTAHFATNNEEPDPAGLPNEIVVEFLHGKDRSRDTIRLSRAAASQLATMLTDALDWDGK